MKIILVCSATGGVGKSTACRRLAEQLGVLGIPSTILDLSPYPSPAGGQDGIKVVQAGAATTKTAAEAVIKPFVNRYKAILIDGPSLGDELLEVWLPLCTELLIVTRVDAFALNSIPAIWAPLEQLRQRYPSLDFLGFLPCLVRTSDAPRVTTLRAAAKAYVFPSAIPHDEGELQAAEAWHFSGLEAVRIPQNYALKSYAENAKFLMERLKLVPEKKIEEAPKSTGILARAWRAAANLLRTQKEEATA